MRFAVAFLLVLLATPLSAQERVYTLTMNASDVNLIAKALRELPYKEAVKILDTIAAQVEAQNRDAEAKAKEAK